MERVKAVGNRGRRFRSGNVVTLTTLLFLCVGTVACGAEPQTDAASPATPSKRAATPKPSERPTPTRTGTPTPSPAALTEDTPSPTPTTIYRIVRLNETIAFDSRTENSASLRRGTVRL